jgi:tRNA (adenine37-N6)-methyltransferase
MEGGMEFDNYCREVMLQPIGVIHSCFSEKFAVPRQPGMVPAATAVLELCSPFNRHEMVRGLEQFSHLWVHFLFHETIAEGWKATIRPPWLGGKKRVGIFASRSPHRPNHMGLSAVKLEAVRCEPRAVFLDLSGVDFLNQTPVIDIKPYVPYSDCLASASCGYADGTTPEVSVTFSAEAEAFCHIYDEATGRNIVQLIIEILRNDPRPASQKGHKRCFAMLLWDVNIRWQVAEGGDVQVEECALIKVR